jgi:hypothetical protein
MAVSPNGDIARRDAHLTSGAAGSPNKNARHHLPLERRETVPGIGPTLPEHQNL